ncbi:serine/threonine-protein kinase SBK1 isoform X1 [Brienomyrus brachyistius]|uniref:serine/threonine-protein kinase SBK1 isoform X1 n=2 Tax=Brienomyrus brachyistius TaxID=42636 RepID=UPI0020B2E6BB|nr:serine/threonine-protein kinase SBK1 isoform X1 [Brienomyrus brachyistius]
MHYELKGKQVKQTNESCRPASAINKRLSRLILRGDAASLLRQPSAKMSSSSTPSRTSPDVLEELQLHAAQNLEKVEISRYYEVIRELGKGTYGKVDLVIHRIRGTKMALKFLCKKTTNLRSFLREYSVSLYLSPCPFIIDMLGIAFQTDEYYIFAQEYALAGDLFDIIPPQVGLPEAVAKRCGRQVAVALDYLHCKKLVHRDIKPENVLLFDRECHRVKLSDFGMAQWAGAPVRRVSGTIPYTAPELSQAAPRQGICVDYSLDVWAFGVLLFCTLTGNFPWEAALPSDPFYQEFLRWQRRPSPAPVPTQWRRFSDEALHTFRRLLSPEPLCRCAARDVLSQLGCRWTLPEGSGEDARDAPAEPGSPPPEEEEQLVDRMKQQTLSPAAEEEEEEEEEENRAVVAVETGSRVLLAAPIEICVSHHSR